MAQNGPVACILKATQGTSYVDPTFKSRIEQARAFGLLVGSYHFGDASDPIAQVDHWLSVANPGAKDVLEFDWEDNPGSGGTMSYDQACAFVAEVRLRTGRFPLIYGSRMLNEEIPEGDSPLFDCPLSLASYNAVPKIPRGWKNYKIWQYTGDDANAKISPHTFPGAENPLDVYQFDGSVAELRNHWPF